MLLCYIEMFHSLNGRAKWPSQQIHSNPQNNPTTRFIALTAPAKSPIPLPAAIAPPSSAACAVLRLNLPLTWEWDKE
jgi:hypothetical protein